MDQLVQSFFFYFGIIAFIGMGIFLFLRATMGRNWWVKFGFGVLLGGQLRDSINILYDEIAARTVKRKTLANVTKHVLWRMTRIGLFGLIFAVLPLIFLAIQTSLLSQQNNKIDRQNDLIKEQEKLIQKQNDHIQLQSHLLEADRRGSLIFLMSNILDLVSQEIKEKKNRNENDNFNISTPLIGRIATLSQAFRPYRYMVGDSLIPQPLSPERGQLLSALVNSKLDRSSYTRICDLTNFSSADLKAARLINSYLPRIKLEGANLEEIEFRSTNLKNGNFKGANLKNANLQGAIFEYANFYYADFSGANVNQANFKGAKFAASEDTDAEERVKGLTYQQLLKARSLYNAKGLPKTLKDSLISARPALFEPI